MTPKILRSSKLLAAGSTLCLLHIGQISSHFFYNFLGPWTNRLGKLALDGHQLVNHIGDGKLDDASLCSQLFLLSNHFIVLSDRFLSASNPKDTYLCEDTVRYFNFEFPGGFRRYFDVIPTLWGIKMSNCLHRVISTISWPCIVSRLCRNWLICTIIIMKGPYIFATRPVSTVMSLISGRTSLNFGWSLSPSNL